MTIVLARSERDFEICFVTDCEDEPVLYTLDQIYRELQSHPTKLAELYDAFTDVDDIPYEVLHIHPYDYIPFRCVQLRSRSTDLRIVIARLLAIVDITVDDIDEHEHEWGAIAPREFWQEFDPELLYRPIVHRIAIKKLREVAPSILDEADFIMFYDREVMAHEHVVDHLRRRGTMIINYRKPYRAFGYIAMVCQKPPNQVVQSIIQRMNDWATMTVELLL